MNFEKWLEIGKMAKIINRAIMDERGEYTKSSKEGRWLRSAENSMTKMRDKLDNLVFEQYPDKTLQELTSVFYGSIEDTNRKSREKSKTSRE